MKIQILSFLSGLVLASLFGSLHFLYLNKIKEKIVKKSFLATWSYILINPLLLLLLGVFSKHINDYFKSIFYGAGGLTYTAVVIGLIIYTAIVVPKFYKYFKEKGAYNVD
jgi:hypothetical protein